MDKALLNRLYRYACTLTGDRDDGYDLVQKAVESYLRTADTVQSAEFYLMRSIRNAWYDQVRKTRLQLIVNEQLRSEQSLQQDNVPPSLFDLLIQEQDVERLMQWLSVEERDLLYLWAVEEYTFQEISELHNIPKGTLLSQMHRLKKRISKKLDTLKSESQTGVRTQEAGV